MTKKKFHASLAASAILGCLQALAVTREDIVPETGIVIWLVFVILCGVTIEPPRRSNTRTLIKASIPASSAFFVCMTFKGALQVASNGAYLTLASIGKVEMEPSGQVDYIKRYGLFYLALFLINIPSLIVAIVAREKVIDSTVRIFSIKSERFSAALASAQALLRLVALVAGAAI